MRFTGPGRLLLVGMLVAARIADAETLLVSFSDRMHLDVVAHGEARAAVLAAARAWSPDVRDVSSVMISLDAASVVSPEFRKRPPAGWPAALFPEWDAAHTGCRTRIELARRDPVRAPTPQLTYECAQALAAWLKQAFVAHHPGAALLEVSVGTGSARGDKGARTVHVIAQLHRHDGWWSSVQRDGAPVSSLVAEVAGMSESALNARFDNSKRRSFARPDPVLSRLLAKETITASSLGPVALKKRCRELPGTITLSPTDDPFVQALSERYRKSHTARGSALACAVFVRDAPERGAGSIRAGLICDDGAATWVDVPAAARASTLHEALTAKLILAFVAARCGP